MRRLLFVVAFCAVLAGCSDDKSADSTKTKTVTIAVNAPFSRTPYVGQTIADGAELAASKAGVEVDGVKYRFRIKRYDTGLSPSTAVRNVRKAIADGAVAIVDEGTGVDASWQIARDKDIPLAVTYQGGEGLIDPAKRPNVFRIAPTDHGMSFRFAEYLIPKKLKVALITDDSSYGQEGAKALDEAFAENPDSVAAKLTVPACRAGSLAPGAPRPPRRSDRAPRLGPADDDCGRPLGGALVRLESPGLHVADRRGPARSPAAREPSGLGRRAHLRVRPTDGRGRRRARS